jgi:hypothetical protein
MVMPFRILHAVWRSSAPRRDTSPRAAMKMPTLGTPTAVGRATVPGVKSFDSFMFLLPDGTDGHGGDLDHLRRAAELEAMEGCMARQSGCVLIPIAAQQGWLLGLRDQRPANDAPCPRRPVVVVTPLGTVGAPVGVLAVALARASDREGLTYLISAFDAVSR